MSLIHCGVSTWENESATCGHRLTPNLQSQARRKLPDNMVVGVCLPALYGHAHAMGARSRADRLTQ